MAEIDTAMVLAAGLGTRIRPIAKDRPKPLVEVAGRALIDYALDALLDAGVRRAVVNLHYKADQIEAHLAGRSEPKIVFSDERAQLMETGGGLIKAAPLLGEGPVFCTNTDAILEGPAAQTLAAAFDDGAMDALMLMVPPQRATGYKGSGDLCLSRDGRLSWEGKSANRLVFTGLQIIHPRLFAGRPPAPQSTRVFWDEAMAKGRLYGLVHEGLWMHVGDPEGHAAATARLS